MKIQYVFLILIGLNQISLGQDCFQNVPKFNGKLCYDIENKKIETYEELLSKYYKIDKKQINRKKELTKIETFFKDSFTIYFGNKHTNFCIELQNDTVYMTDVPSKTGIESLDKNIFIQEKFNNKLIGNYKDSGNLITFSRIKNIFAKIGTHNFQIADSLFSNFINPNYENNLYSLRPIEIYKNNKKDEYYIYIMGDLPIIKNGSDIKIDISKSSYIVKLILVPGLNKTDKVFIDSEYLVKFCWPFVSDFWPF